MASRKTIANLAAILTADTKQFRAEMKSASAQLKVSQGEISGSFGDLSSKTNTAFRELEQKNRIAFRSMSKEINGTKSISSEATRGITSDFDQIGASISRAFSPANFAKGLLAGAGIGSAMMLINSAVDKFVSLWTEAERNAKEVEDRAKSIEEVIGRLSKIRIEAFEKTLDPSELIAKRRKEVDSLIAQQKKLETTRTRSLEGVVKVQGESNISARVKNWYGEDFGETGIGARTFADTMLKRADEAQKAWAEAAVKIAEIKAEINKLEEPLKEADINNVLTDYFGKVDAEAESLTRRAKLESDIAKEVADAQAKINTALSAMRDEEIYSGMKSQNDLEKLFNGDQTFEDSPNQQLADMFSGSSETFSQDWEVAFEETSKASEEFARDMEQTWDFAMDGFSSAIADAVIDGELNFDNLANSFSKMVVQMAVKWAMLKTIESIGLAEGSGWAGVFSGKAVGGHVNAGETYMVGEKGRELFTPDTSGMITPNNRLTETSAASGDLNVTINAPGADAAQLRAVQAELRNLQKTFNNRVFAANSDNRMRTGRF